MVALVDQSEEGLVLRLIERDDVANRLKDFSQWSAESHISLQVQEKLGNCVSVAWSDDGTKIAAGFVNGFLALYDVDKNRQLTLRYKLPLDGQDGKEIRHLIFTQHDAILLAGGDLIAYRTVDGLRIKDKIKPTPLTSLAAAPSGRNCAVGGSWVCSI